MPAYPLILDTQPPQPGWVVEWDNTELKLREPDGQVYVKLPLKGLHRVIDLRQLDAGLKIVFGGPIGSMAFTKADRAARELKQLVLKSLKSDPAMVEQHTREARLQIVLGLAMFFICGGIFGGYCWWASIAPDPVPAWVHLIGWLIHLVLLVCLAGVIRGPVMVYVYCRRLVELRNR